MINKPEAPMGPAPSDYQTQYEQWSQMPPPNPKALIQLLLTPGFLTKHQIDAIKALLSQPGAPQGSPTQAPPTQAPTNLLGGGTNG